MLRVTLAVFLISGVPTVTGAEISVPQEGVAQSVSIIELTSKAEGGDIDAQLELGRIYSEGSGVEVSINIAKKWYKLAVRQGSAEAQYRLAMLTDFPNQRWNLLVLAANSGHRAANLELDRIEKEEKRLAADQAERERVEAETAEKEKLALEELQQERQAAAKAEEELLIAEQVQQEKSVSQSIFSFRQLAVLSLWSEWFTKKKNEVRGTRTAAEIEGQISDLPFHVDEDWLDDVVKWQANLAAKPAQVDSHFVKDWICIAKKMQNEGDLQFSGGEFYKKLTCHSSQNLVLNSNDFEYFMGANFEIGFSSENNDFVQFRLFVSNSLAVPYPIFVNDVLRFSGFVGCDESLAGELGADIQCYVGIVQLENLGEFNQRLQQEVIADRSIPLSQP